MKLRSTAGLLFVGLSSVLVGSAQAQLIARNAGGYALKSGESVELSDVYYVINCRSQLTAPPTVTVMDGPPGVTASLTEAMVLPRFQKCPGPVKGAKLRLSAEKIEEQSYSDMTIRIKYETKAGMREHSMTFSLALFP